MDLHRALSLCACITLPLAACGDDGGGSTSDASTSDSPPATSSPITSSDPSVSTTTELETSTSTTDPAPTSTDPGTTGTSADPGTSTGETASESSDTGAGAVDYMADIQPIWDMRCVAGCHIETGIAQNNGPILTEEKSYDQIVDVLSPTVPGIVHIAPGSLDDSYLWHKVNGTQANVGGLGLQMPQGGMLTAEELATINAWIVGGAKP